MRLDKTTITAIAKLAGAHSTLSMMIMVEGGGAYELYESNRGEVATTLEVAQAYLGLKTCPRLPSTRRTWTAAKRSLPQTGTKLRKDVRHELVQVYGGEAALLYDYSLLISECMWASGLGLAVPHGVHDEIKQFSKRYAVGRTTLTRFLENPGPDTSRAILEAVVKHLERVTFFISYSHEDSEFVGALVGCLEQPSIRIWQDKKDILPSDSISEKLEDAIPDSDFFCLVLSSDSVKSPWVQREYRLALHSQVTTGSPRILPILVEKVELPAFLRDIKYADFSRTFDRGMEELVAIITDSS